MALTNEDLQAISQLFDEKLDKKLAESLQPINDRLDNIDNQLNNIELKQKQTNKKLNDLKLDVQIAERDIRRDIHDLNDEMETVIAVLKMNDIISL